MPFPPRSAYLHIPFCHRRCFYCDFPVVPLGDRAAAEPGQPGAASIAAYLQLLLREIAASPPGPPLSTVYFGGGTPSLLRPDQLAALLAALRRRFGLAPAAEVSLELDPASFDQVRLAGYMAVGVNRVSLGGQSFDDAVLERLGRRHRAADLHQASGWLDQARQRGDLASWSLDLIQAVPGQDRDGWRRQLALAVASGAPHLSVYDLTIEPGTVFGRRLEQGQLQLPDDDLAADLMELTATTLAAAGYGHYEISNYAQPGHASRHNRVYWSGAGWWGFGMGATAAPWGERQARPRSREAYAAWVEQQLPAAAQAAAAPMPLDERLMVGLRRREGVRLPQLLAQAIAAALQVSRPPVAAEAETAAAATTALAAAQPAVDPVVAAALQSALPELRQRLQPWLASGLLLEEGERWRLSDPEGLALSNGVLRELLAWWEQWDGSGWRSSPAGPPPPAAVPAAAVD